MFIAKILWRLKARVASAPVRTLRFLSECSGDSIAFALLGIALLVFIGSLIKHMSERRHEADSHSYFLKHDPMGTIPLFQEHLWIRTPPSDPTQKITCTKLLNPGAFFCEAGQVRAVCKRLEYKCYELPPKKDE